ARQKNSFFFAAGRPKSRPIIYSVPKFRQRANTTLTFYSMERGGGGGGSLELAGGGGGGGGGNAELCLQDLVTNNASLSVQHHQHAAAAASMAGLHGDHLQGSMHHHDIHGNSHHDASTMLHNSSHQLHHEPLEKLKRGESLTIPVSSRYTNDYEFRSLLVTLPLCITVLEFFKDPKTCLISLIPGLEPDTAAKADLIPMASHLSPFQFQLRGPL
ncbi:pituitary homeobox x, partial [Vespula maculifrons]